VQRAEARVEELETAQEYFGFTKVLASEAFRTRQTMLKFGGWINWLKRMVDRMADEMESRGQEVRRSPSPATARTMNPETDAEKLEMLALGKFAQSVGVTELEGFVKGMLTKMEVHEENAPFQEGLAKAHRLLEPYARRGAADGAERNGEDEEDDEEEFELPTSFLDDEAIEDNDEEGEYERRVYGSPVRTESEPEDGEEDRMEDDDTDWEGVGQEDEDMEDAAAPVGMVAAGVQMGLFAEDSAEVKAAREESKRERERARRREKKKRSRQRVKEAAREYRKKHKK
jgi:hypothetical protein